MTDCIRVDLAQITLREMAAAGRLVAPRKLAEMLADQDPEGIAAMVCILHQRDDPTFTYDQALDLPMSAIDMGGDDDSPNLPSANNGAQQLASLASGDSTLPQ